MLQPNAAPYDRGKARIISVICRWGRRRWGEPAKGFSSGQAMTPMEDVAAKVLPSDVGYEWTAMSCQEKVTGNRILDGKPILEAALPR
jgi:hypothetical protein